MSVRKLIEKGANIHFGTNGCQVLFKKEVVTVTLKHGGLYRLKIHDKPDKRTMVLGQGHTKDCKHTWHRSLGHREDAAIQQIVSKNLQTGIQADCHDCGIQEVCKPCLEWKQSRKQFAKFTKKKSTTVARLRQGMLRNSDPIVIY